jgi:tRNA G46 methylase TrmB
MKKLIHRNSIINIKKKYDIDIFEKHPNTIKNALRHSIHFDKFYDNNVFKNHTILAYEEATKFVDNFYKDSNKEKVIILDSGCGKGMSTLKLAMKFPNFPIIGIDKSIVRLSSNKIFNKINDVNNDVNSDNDVYSDNKINDKLSYNNVILIQAELSDFFLLAATKSNWIVKHHYILYPNPFPKYKHLKRRFHPSFLALLSLGGDLIVRSNWVIYLEEMEDSIKSIENKLFIPTINNNYSTEIYNSIDDDSGSMSHFEMKYDKSDTKVYQLKVHLGKTDLNTRLKILNLQ